MTVYQNSDDNRANGGIKGIINIPADFPFLNEVENLDTYLIGQNVTDNDPTRTNTGQSFTEGQIIVWDTANLDWVSSTDGADIQTLWGYQDFPAGSITTTSVTLTANENGIDAEFNPANFYNYAEIYRSDGTDWVYTSGFAGLFQGLVDVANESGVSITLNKVPNPATNCRVWWIYQGLRPISGYIIPPENILNSAATIKLDELFQTKIVSPTNNNIVTTDADGQTKDSGKTFTNTWQGISENLITSQKALYDGLNSLAAYEAVYVDPTNGNDSTGNGTLSKPFRTIQAAINSFTAGSPHVIYVNGSTTANITFRSGDQSMMIVLDPKTLHIGTITFVAGNTSIYFLSQSGKSTISGTINDASSGNIYFDALVSGTYNKTGGSGSAAPTGYVEFSPNSCIDNLILNVSGNSTIRTLGTGAMGQLTQSNGLIALQHKGSVYAPTISGGANPLLGQPIALFQGQLQLIKNGSNKSLICTASYGLVYIAGISTFQNDFATFGKIDFTGSGANCFCYVWSNSQLATSGDVFPPTGALLPNLADYTSANYTPTNYTPTSGSVKGQFEGINSRLGGKQDLIVYVANQAAMLALTNIAVGYIVARVDLGNSFYRLNALPASTLSNWSQVAGSQINTINLQETNTVFVDPNYGSDSNDGLSIYSKVATIAKALTIASNNWVINIVSNSSISYSGNISLTGLTILLSPNTTLTGTIGLVSSSSVTFTGGKLSATINDSSVGITKFQNIDLSSSVITHSGSSSKFYQTIYNAPTSISTSGGTGTLFLSEIQNSVRLNIAGGWSIRKKDCQLQISTSSTSTIVGDNLNILSVLATQGELDAVSVDGLYAVNFVPSSPTGATSGSILERASGVWYIVELGFYAQPTISVGTTTKTTWVKISDKWYSLGQNVSQLNYMTCSIGSTSTRTASQAQMPLIQVVTSGNITVTGNGINLKGGRTYQLITNVYHNGSANWGSYKWFTTASGGSGSFGNPIAGATVTFTGNENGGCNNVFVYSPASDTTIYLRESESGIVYSGTAGGYSSIAVIDITPSPSIVVGNVFSTGDVVFSMATSKTGALICDGTLYSKSLYSDLWNMKNSSVGNVTISVASVAVFTLNSHGFVNGQAVYITTTGALPSTITQHRTYFVNVVTANTFNLATSVANLMARTYISTTSTSQSGTHTVFKNFIQSWDIDNFFMDWRGFTIASISSARSGAYFGADTHQLLVSELASHNHADNYVIFDSASGTFAINSGNFRMTPTTTLTGGAGSNVPHNNLQPTVFCGNWFIYF